MELQEVDIFIEQDGQVRIEVRGAKGQFCLDLTSSLEKALGGQIESREMTHEAQVTVSESDQDQLRQTW